MKTTITIMAILMIGIGAIIGLFFYLDNLQVVTVSFMGKTLAELHLALWLLLFFAAGALLGWLVASTQVLWYRYQLRSVRKSQPELAELTLKRAPLLNS